MKKKGNLFYLIKSLTPSEKRYFKLFCNMHQESSNHLRLFDAMDRQDHLDDNEIRQIFKGEPFVNQLHVTKNYLQGLILKSLRNFHASISKETEIRNLIMDAEILFSKELADQCYYTLEKAEKLAIRYDDFTALYEIYDWKRRLFTSKFGLASSEFKSAITDQTQILEELKHINHYWNLIANVSNFDGSYEVDSEEKDELEDINQIGSLRRKILYHHYQFGKYLMTREGDTAELHIDQIIGLLELHPDRIANDPNLYITSLGNKVPMLLYQKRWSEALEVLQKMRGVAEGLRIKNSKFSARAICRSYNLELELYRDKKDFKSGVRAIEEVGFYISQNTIPEDYNILFWNQFSHLYFGNKNYEKALEWVNKILDDKSTSWLDIAAYARILHLMIHFELGNMIFIRYAADSHRRFLKKHKKLRPFERVCLKYLLKTAMTSETKRAEILHKLYLELFDSDQPMVNQEILDYIDIKGWLINRTKSIHGFSENNLSIG